MVPHGLMPFRPQGALRNGHLQSIFPSLPLQRLAMWRRSAPLRRASEPVLLECGGDVRLQAFHARPPAPDGRLAVLLHGWEGSADAAYILSLAQDLHDRGVEVVRVNLRDHGGTQHLNRGLFHSCRLEDVTGALQDIDRRWPGRRLWLVGFSLGGNFMLRAAASPVAPQLPLAGVVAISPVLDPARATLALEHGLPVYRRYFIWKWSRSLRRKQRAWPGEYDFGELLRDADLRRMTDRLVRRYTEFPSLEAYFEGYAITGQRLAGLKVPAWLLTAKDDPIIPAADLDRLAQSPALKVFVTEHGGHTGFLERPLRPSWANQFVLAAMDSPG
ncbi:MAG: hypothetical protein RL026_2784 [Pseudomonadota bacterium]